jgi:hypothetical protein
MKRFLNDILPGLPGEVHTEVEKEVKQLVARTRKQLLGEMQQLLAAYNLSQQADLDHLRREIDRLFLEAEDQ